MPKKTIHTINGKKGACLRWGGVNPDPVIRFWSKVDISGLFDCWLWKGGKFPTGYGAFSYDAKTRRAHRVAWEFTYGKIPEGKIILHSCDAPSCVNPNHLRVGTNRKNSQDMVKRGRSARGEKQGSSILKVADVIEIRRLIRSGERREDVAITFGVTSGTIWEVVNRTWRHVKEASND